MRVYWRSARGRPFARGVRRMPDAPRIRPILKRGALVAAANWQLVAIQSAAEVAFQVLLAVPVAGGALLVGAVAGGDVGQLVGGGLWPVVVSTAAALTATPMALAAFLAAFTVVLLGGSLLMFVIKAGTVAILAEAETAAGPVERPPLRWSIIGRAGRFDIDRFLDGAGRLGRRYAGLGLALFAVYGASGALYLLVAVQAYHATGDAGAIIGWTIAAAVATVGFFCWITILNVVYTLIQMVMATDDCSVRAAAGRVAAFLRARLPEVAAVVGIVLALVVLATLASIVAAAGLGLIAFVPVAGVIVVPLQLAAWLVRGFLFEYLALTALGAYVAQYRTYRREAGLDPARPAPAVFPEGRTA